METRMYRSLRGIVEGWSKNLALGSRQAVSPWLAPFAPWLIGLGALFFWVVPPVVLIASFFTPVQGFFVGWSIAATSVSVIFWLAIHLLFRIPLLHALLYPVGAIVHVLPERTQGRDSCVEGPGVQERPGGVLKNVLKAEEPVGTFAGHGSGDPTIPGWRQP